VAVLQGKNDDYQTELFKPIIKKIEEISGKKYDEEVNQGSMRIIADHLRAATFLIADGVVPSNVERGYILRRLIRRAARHIRRPQYIKPFAREIAAVVIDQYQDVYPELKYNEQELFNILNTEEERFSQTLDRGLKEIEKILRDKDISNPPVGKTKILSGDRAFYLYESFGFPLELTREILMEKGIEIDGEEFKKKLAEHQEKSRKGAKNKFAGGLADHSEIAVCYHTATHLLQAALRKILGNQVHQIGSNITAERARFDFTHPEKLTGQEISKIEKLINEKIAADLPVKKQIMLLAAAKNSGALAFFGEKYPNRVFVYTIGDFSKEICGGPHVTRTSQIGKIKVIREEGAGAGKRRIYLKIDRTYGEAGSF
jgi:alanyl-tRNA synthetase